MTEGYLNESIRLGMLSNFGPSYDVVKEIVYHRYDRHCLPVTNGTVAIQIACQAILNKGSRIVMPDYTHIGTYVGVRDAGMIPIFSKCREDTWALDAEVLLDELDEFDAIVVVSPFGYYVDIKPYEKIARDHGKKIIYDYAGAWPQIPATEFPVCYSTHATKSMTTGEGGFILFENEKQCERARKLTNFSIDESGMPSYDIGGNYKMDEVRCSMLASHLANSGALTEHIGIRKDTLIRYLKELNIEIDYKFMFSSPSMCVIPGIKEFHYTPARHFKHKYYYKKLTSIPALNDVLRLSQSSDYFDHCLALPIDVTTEEQCGIIEEVKNRHSWR